MRNLSNRFALLGAAAMLAFGAFATPGQAAFAAPAGPAASPAAKASWPCGFSHHKGVPQYGDWYYNCTWAPARITIKWADGHVTWSCVEADMAKRLGDLYTVEDAWISARC
ncbi:hypothetical protein [Streptomyces sp. NPDC003877]